MPFCHFATRAKWHTKMASKSRQSRYYPKNRVRILARAARAARSGAPPRCTRVQSIHCTLAHRPPRCTRVQSMHCTLAHHLGAPECNLCTAPWRTTQWCARGQSIDWILAHLCRTTLNKSPHTGFFAGGPQIPPKTPKNARFGANVPPTAHQRWRVRILHPPRVANWRRKTN